MAVDDAIAQKKYGLVTVVGTKKFHFMSDTKWLLKQGFEVCDNTDSGFCLLVKKFNKNAENPVFNESVRRGECDEKNGVVVYYSNRCPFTEFHVNTSLIETLKKRDIQLKIIKFVNNEQTLNSPSPATIFSLFYNGKFITTDLSVCMDSRFDKIMSKYLIK